MIQWRLDQNGGWREVLCDAAAVGGSLRILKWARAKGCPWGYDTGWGAAGMGHLGILQWARSENCPWDARTCAWAARDRHLDVLQ